MAMRRLHLLKFASSSALANPSTSTRTFANSAGQQFTTLNVDDKTGIATLTLNRPPANALNAASMSEIQRTIQDLEKSKCRGLILTSASDRIFSAGLDLKECYQADTASLKVIFCALQNLWHTLFATPLTTVALINGHAMAGGCLLAASSEYRIMLPNFKIGLNDTMAGLGVPMFVMDSYTNAVSSRRIAERDLTASRVYSSEEALQAGLVDEVATSKEQALETAVALINSFEQRTLTARAKTKLLFRAEILKNFEKNSQHDLDIFLSTIQRPEVQAYLGKYLQSLKNRQSKQAKA
ncbi:enoyl-CoA delta isomerase 1, mitochondrial-like [Rhagoletis pomonella]|uniref:enoyl-CoA delta isomerase 1, mitochondrial-like n=1 Tax=Rhagoletis pomonella TaxID=28610 RepID=UPI00177E0FE7|nr:enoyl-CoA delta isomerase 1, mitochondrial-like [Rhagoletis pomonella]